jgi:hypothetical protein
LSQGSAVNLTGQFPRQFENGQVIFRQTDAQIVVTLDFRCNVRVFLEGRQVKLAAEKVVDLGAIVQLIIVRARIAILVPGEEILFSRKERIWAGSRRIRKVWSSPLERGSRPPRYMQAVLAAEPSGQ